VLLLYIKVPTLYQIPSEVDTLNSICFIYSQIRLEKAMNAFWAMYPILMLFAFFGGIAWVYHK